MYRNKQSDVDLFYTIERAQLTFMNYSRFVSNNFSELEKANHSPIYGYQHLPILTLEEATDKLAALVPGIADYVSKAKARCNRKSELLTRDESAAI